jgi:2-methylcitrate dehydratase PrpD
MAVVNEQRLRLQDVKSIKVYVSKLVMDIACGKMEEPRTGLEGKFSMQYCVANAILRGETGLRAFTDEKVNDPEVRTLMKKISMVLDPKIDRIGARVEIETNAGVLHKKYSDIMEEIPEIETKRKRVSEKYMELCGQSFDHSKAADSLQIILSLEKVDNMRKFVEKTVL